MANETTRSGSRVSAQVVIGLLVAYLVHYCRQYDRFREHEAHRAARADAFEPLAAERGGQAEEHDREREDPAEFGKLPVIRC